MKISILISSLIPLLELVAGNQYNNLGGIGGSAIGFRAGVNKKGRSYITGYDDGYAAGKLRGKTKWYDLGKLDGLNMGRSKGFKAGRMKGFEEGRSKGLEEGRVAGIEQGRKEGFSTGNTQGYQQGLAKGIADGQAKGLSDGLAQGKAAGIAEGIAQGQQRGFDDGFSKGQHKGFADGQAKGLADGLAQGKAAGIAEGISQGQQRGFGDGFAKGKAKGISSGHDSGMRAGFAKGQNVGYKNGLRDGLNKCKAERLVGFTNGVQKGFLDGYAKCKADRKARRLANSMRITPRNVELMKKAINSRCMHKRCNLDLTLGKRNTNILVRLQCHKCPTKTDMHQCMNKLADKLGAGKNIITSSYSGCNAFGSWTFVPRKISPGNHFISTDASKFGNLLPLPRKFI
ncbi:Epsin-1 [Smittium mucronatum]|uniref:Epsin-1 n=1 Tax=Smittium mucronatum TaxID=133383 RepID=A0A1R0GW92_9FUNG|nr:Epsin-1 [Smittium mucronatum]